RGIAGPLFIGKDTHALSCPALESAVSVLAANGVKLRCQKGDAPTPTPVISHAILTHNAEKRDGADNQADGIVITPSHNPPEDGGFKYNESHGGPAGTEVTAWIQNKANGYLENNLAGVKRLGPAESAKAAQAGAMDYIAGYVDDLSQVINMRAIAESGLRLGADPLGGSSLPFWEPVARRYGINLTVVNKSLDPLFRFMPKDHDGKIRMDCSSPDAMAGLIAHAADYDIAFGNDPDADRHGIVTPEGLMNPNHYLCASVWYLLQHRPDWPASAAIGKTCVTTSLMDRLCAAQQRPVHETPVGFKWFVEGLNAGALLFGGEESAGASFLRMNGKPWSTDKDGVILNLLAAEMTAVTGKNPAALYKDITRRFDEPCYARIDAPATSAEKAAFKTLTPAAITQSSLAGDPITRILTRAPGNNEAIGGLKVETAKGWFAARPSGTEDIYKIYAESFAGPEHLKLLQDEARLLVAAAFAAAG
ncbi:MAG: phosphoglucomutase, alpha-D-glucose phosphate-specific, partial [Desulfovibrio sp.]|nr:phosphoglucomutase, alpha-D-glucose phosphate-specific [Desulfovibrio sp.]